MAVKCTAVFFFNFDMLMQSYYILRVLSENVNDLELQICFADVRRKLPKITLTNGSHFGKHLAFITSDIDKLFEAISNLKFCLN